MDIIPANSLTFELAHVMTQRCTCGGQYQFMGQQLLMMNELPIDRLRARCTDCETEAFFFFDIHTFYDQPPAADRFAHTEALLREALATMATGDWPAAETLLRRVIDPREGEPAFGWAHYQLGLVLLAQNQRTEGIQHIEEALRWVPNEPAFIKGLEKARADEAQKEHPDGTE